MKLSLLTELILYACPTGELADQLDRFFARSRALCGENSAHRYMPHCTLTGFFRDLPDAVSLYTRAIDRLLAESRPPEPVITIRGVTFAENFHGLELESPWLNQLARDFATEAESVTRADVIRPKDWLHLSLAYDFPPEQHATLRDLAESMVTLSAAVRWELRFYERQPGNHWVNHKVWPL